MPPHRAAATMTACTDCGTTLRRDNPGPRCAECALVDRNAQYDTPALRRRRDELLRLAAIAARIAEMNEHWKEYPR